MGLEMLSGGTVSDPRGHVKNHPDRGNFSVAAGRIRPRVPPRQRRDDRQRCLLAMGATLAGRVKKVEEGAEEGNGRPENQVSNVVAGSRIEGM